MGPNASESAMAGSCATRARGRIDMVGAYGYEGIDLYDDNVDDDTEDTILKRWVLANEQGHGVEKA